MNTGNNKRQKKSTSLGNLLFDGLIYRVISEPDGLRRSADDMHAFIEATSDLDFDNREKRINDASSIISRIKDKDGMFSAFEAFLENNPYGLILLDNDFNHIFHNQKSNIVFDSLFNGDSPKKLKYEIICSINKLRGTRCQSTQNLLTIKNVIDSNLYLITGNQKKYDEQGFNILLTPSTTDNKFQLHNSIVEEYNFTNREQALLTSLISGLELKEIAELHNITLNTTRSHLKSIFRKTNTKSQTSLIRLFLNHESQLIDSFFKSELVKQADGFDNKDLFITLKNKKQLCYRDYGPKDGRPLIIFHNTFGSRYHIPYDYEPILEKANRRIIVPERPGYGRSDVMKNYLPNWHDFFIEFLDQINVDQYCLLGNVYGSPIALKFASEHPNGINKLILTSPTFFNHANQKSSMGDLMKGTGNLVAFSKILAVKMFKLWMKSMKYDPDRYVRNMIHQYSGSAEQQKIKDEKFIQRLILNYIESQKNESSSSAEDSLFCLTPLNLDFSKIELPIEIWLGDEDLLIPADTAREICAPLPNKTFNIRKGHSEDIFYHLFEEIIH